MPSNLFKNMVEKFQWKCTLANSEYLKKEKNAFMWAALGTKSRLGGKHCLLAKNMWAVKTRTVDIYAHMPTQKQQIHKISLYNSGHTGRGWEV